MSESTYADKRNRAFLAGFGLLVLAAIAWAFIPMPVEAGMALYGIALIPFLFWGWYGWRASNQRAQ
ncbi:MAG: hypothetical protein AAB955_02990 [Patescibacteria group bacterium]